MQVRIETNFPQVAAALRQFGSDVTDKATVRALNRIIEQARTRMSREIRAEFVLPAAKVREALRIKRASFAGGVLSVEAVLFVSSTSKRSMNVINFAARQTAQGVTVKIKRSAGRRLIRNAFIANQGRTVFERVPGTKMGSRKWGGQHGERIKPVQTIDVPQMFNTRKINEAVVQAIRQTSPVVFERELRFYAQKAGVFTP